MDQTGEEIIFSRNADHTITCVIRISYEGPSQHFAWLVPVGGIPKVSVSSNVAFERLSQATAPSYVLERHVEGQCSADQRYPTYGSDGAGSFSVDAGVAAPPAVQVLDQGSVGPYDYVTISVDPAAASPADAAIQWLQGEGFDVVGTTASVLGPYLADGQNLIAFRLTKGVDSGAIRPVILTYNGDKPSIPIRPTAVAARDDMGVLVWVLADRQAVPENYRSLVLNEALIDWFDPMSTYQKVVTAAANEAGGQGFVTELAGSTGALSETVFSSSDATALPQLTQQQATSDPIDLIFSANNYFRGWDGWRDSIAAAVTLPAGVTLDDFGRNPDMYRGAPGVVIDTAKFLDHLRTDVVEPVQRTQDLLNSLPYVTRLYTTMSASEMTLDPLFTFNPDLAPVSNVHKAQLYIECTPALYEWQAPWRLLLPQGGILRGSSQQSGGWPFYPGGSVPSSLKVVQLSQTGSGDVVTDNRAKMAGILLSRGGTPTSPMPTDVPPDGGVPIGGFDRPLPSNDSGGCSVGTRGSSSTNFGMVLVAGAGLLSRRRGRRSKRRGR